MPITTINHGRVPSVTIDFEQIFPDALSPIQAHWNVERSGRGARLSWLCALFRWLVDLLKLSCN